MGAWTEFIWLRIRIGGGQFECSNEASGCIHYGEILDWLGNC